MTVALPSTAMKIRGPICWPGVSRRTAQGSGSGSLRERRDGGCDHHRRAGQGGGRGPRGKRRGIQRGSFQDHPFYGFVH